MKVNIRPEVTILGLLSHLNYKAWYAIAEFVDNSLQSYLTYRKELEQAEGVDFKLRVSIDIEGEDGGTITIRDNAAGIAEKDYARAFRPAEVPPDRSGLSEFGIGMKSAACWFAKRFTVHSSALGEPVQRTVTFDIGEIVNERMEDLEVREREAPPDRHFTTIQLSPLHSALHGRTIGKIREHLASIYRVFLREGQLEIFVQDVPVEYEEPDVLTASHYKNPEEAKRLWTKEIDLDLGRGLRASGFGAIRAVGSTSHAGFALFRRGRLIVGSADETYRPKFIFEDPNGYLYQRIFGELELEGFNVSHTKDGFQWGENEEPFLELLKTELNSTDLPLLDQAKGYRPRIKRPDVRMAAELVATHTAELLERTVEPLLERQSSQKPTEEDAKSEQAPSVIAASRLIRVTLSGVTWIIALDLTTDPSALEWVTVVYQPEGGLSDESQEPRVNVKVSLSHPFMERFAGPDYWRLEPFLRIAAGLALSEVAARRAGVKYAGTIRRNLNELLRESLAGP